MLLITFSVGLSNVLNLLKSEDLDVQIHAVKVVANLAAEGNTHDNLCLYYVCHVKINHLPVEF